MDFITPVVDSPEYFGKIAAANSLSDVYAMGGKPLIALNVVCFPTDCEPLDVLKQILNGGAQKAIEAGAMLAGGHSVQDEEPKYGLVVFGEVKKDRMWTVGTAKPGDVLILTKPIGTGIAVTAIKAGLFSDENIDAAVQSMAKLNSIPKVLSEDICRAVTACTDVTGFGLAGHALDLLSDGASLEIEMESLPLLPGIGEMADMGLIPAGAYRNKEHSGSKVINESRMGIFAEDLIFDPQTSGGLLIAIPSELEEELIKQLHAGGFNWSVRIGKFVEGDNLIKLV
ncbi:MAG: Selenide, water dikinase [Synergistaceae bacterium]